MAALQNPVLEYQALTARGDALLVPDLDLHVFDSIRRLHIDVQFFKPELTPRDEYQHAHARVEEFFLSLKIACYGEVGHGGV